MSKQTLEAAVSARRNDPRALRGAITMIGGKPRIVFGVVGEHRRFSVDINGDDLNLADDPRLEIEQEAEKAPYNSDVSEVAPKDDNPQDEQENGSERQETPSKGRSKRNRK